MATHRYNLRSRNVMPKEQTPPMMEMPTQPKPEVRWMSKQVQDFASFHRLVMKPGFGTGTGGVFTMEDVKKNLYWSRYLTGETWRENAIKYLARNTKIDLSEINGSGCQDCILRRDIEDFINLNMK